MQAALSVNEEEPPNKELNVNGESMIMEVDTGAAVTVVSENALQVQIQKTNKVLKSATGQVLELVGQAKVKAVLRGKIEDLTIFVAKGNFHLH